MGRKHCRKGETARYGLVKQMANSSLSLMKKYGTISVNASPRERSPGLIPGRDRPKSLKLVVVACPLGAQDYGNTTTTGPPVSR